MVLNFLAIQMKVLRYYGITSQKSWISSNSTLIIPQFVLSDLVLFRLYWQLLKLILIMSFSVPWTQNRLSLYLSNWNFLPQYLQANSSKSNFNSYLVLFEDFFLYIVMTIFYKFKRRSKSLRVFVISLFYIHLFRKKKKVLLRPAVNVFPNMQHTEALILHAVHSACKLWQTVWIHMAAEQPLGKRVLFLPVCKQIPSPGRMHS